ncbi:MAG TPA: hypothetical protein VGP38_12600 [Rubrobacter sp.]|nr:hypothetical protein [Rubrobacter sp.]
MRIRRGTLRSEKSDDRVYVWMDDEAYGDHNTVHPQDEVKGSALTEELREQVRYLREQLDREREARTEERRRHDTLMAQLMQRIPELEAPSEQPEAPETVEEGPEASEPRSGTPGPQTAPQRRSLWRRVFGG